MTTPLLAEAPQTQGKDTAVVDAPAKTPSQEKPQPDAKPQATPDAKPSDKAEAKPGEKPAEKPAESPKKAPETYSFKTPRGLPEGHVVDESVSESFQKVAREFDLTNDQAQKLLDEVVPVIHRRAQEQQTEIHNKWVEAVKADKVIGGEKLNENLAVAKRFVSAYGDDELKQLLNGPLGSNPALLRAFFKAGKTVSPEKFVAGDPPGNADPNDPAVQARKLYPNSPSS